MDKELERLNADMLEAIRQMKRGESAEIHTPEKIKARRGRPPGRVAAVTKTPVKLRLDPDLLAALRASGRGWQTRVNDLLRREVLGARPDAPSSAEIDALFIGHGGGLGSVDSVHEPRKRQVLKRLREKHVLAE